VAPNRVCLALREVKQTVGKIRPVVRRERFSYRFQEKRSAVKSGLASES
jgi:hypothetical protein